MASDIGRAVGSIIGRAMSRAIVEVELIFFVSKDFIVRSILIFLVILGGKINVKVVYT